MTHDYPWTPVDPLGEALHLLRMSGVFYYANPGVIHFGAGSVNALGPALAKLGARRIALVTTRSLVAEERLVSLVHRALGDARVAVSGKLIQASTKRCEIRSDVPPR